MRFQQKTLWVRSALTAVFVSLRSPSRDPRLPAWHNYSSQSFGASSILLFKVAGCWQAQKIRIQNRCLPRLRLIAHGTFPRRSSTSGVGFVQPSSRSPRSPHLKSHSRQRRPTRLKVMTGNLLGKANSDLSLWELVCVILWSIFCGLIKCFVYQRGSRHPRPPGALAFWRRYSA
jgi:hypothetical protein